MHPFGPVKSGLPVGTLRTDDDLIRPGSNSNAKLLMRRVVCLNFDNSGNLYWIVVDLNICGKNPGKGTTGVPAKPKFA
jgi:hypothetical protein